MPCSFLRCRMSKIDSRHFVWNPERSYENGGNLFVRPLPYRTKNTRGVKLINSADGSGGEFEMILIGYWNAQWLKPKILSFLHSSCLSIQMTPLDNFWTAVLYKYLSVQSACYLILLITMTNEISKKIRKFYFHFDSAAENDSCAKKALR